ncbi:iron complex transport system permease protein [Lutimaribacter pacificus]|uniref:Iron complex transport system permease protein n=1 Tax=Lutimaribacter pacificus TaxID=391948 RepID=A0A1H0N7H1_9RHOB|nr:iron complex transport system permease protein [Lutimaribacter pacificus]SHK86589.1 iron complex transport system permease protein [Lutimaribacter pacificus]
MSSVAHTETAAWIVALRVARRKARLRLIAIMLGLVVTGVGLTLVTGPSMTTPSELLRILAGYDVPGASFSVRELRLPRAVLSIIAGMSFGLGGVIFQTLLRNPLASPDIIGISAGASAAAVFAIVVLGWDGSAVSILAVIAGMAVALLIYLLAWRDGVAGARLILVGIGLSAMLDSMIAYVLSRAPAWTMQDALRWLTGSVNGATLAEALPVLLSLTIFGGLLLARRDNLEAMRLGDDTAAALGVPLAREKLLAVMAAVGLIAVATAVSGPIAFVAFLSGPIAKRITGPGRSPLIAAALVGALLVLLGDYTGQHLLAGRYPVGVVTGALGAPYLIFLIIRSHRSGREA